MTSNLARRPRRKPRKPARGSALITVILVVLVLTVVGIGVAYFTQVEDRISGNDRLAKTSFYAAETGLRTGEDVLATYSGTVNALLGVATPSGTFTPPGGGQVAKSFRIGSVTYLNRNVPRLPAETANQYYLTSQYSLYLRNNVEDRGAVGAVSGVLDPALDSDNKVNLIAVGTVVLPGGSAVTRVLEEQLEFTAATTPACLQADCNQGGTGSIAK